MKHKCIFVSCVIALCSCFALDDENKATSNESFEISIYTSIPIRGKNQNFVNYDLDTFILKGVGERRLFRFEIKNTLFGFTSSEKSGLQKNRFFYLAYNSGEANGIYLDTKSPNNFKKVDVDSFLSLNDVRSFSALFQNDYSVIRKELDNEGAARILVAKPKLKKDSTYPDSTKWFFDKRQTNLAYSISKEADSIYSSKLTKIQTIFAPRSSNGITIPEQIYTVGFTHSSKISKMESDRIFAFLE
jgi:hypothetical protein